MCALPWHPQQGYFGDNLIYPISLDGSECHSEVHPCALQLQLQGASHLWPAGKTKRSATKKRVSAANSTGTWFLLVLVYLFPFSPRRIPKGIPTSFGTTTHYHSALALFINSFTTRRYIITAFVLEITCMQIHMPPFANPVPRWRMLKFKPPEPSQAMQHPLSICCCWQ